LEDTKAKHSKERQTLVLECKGRVEAKEQLLRKKALEYDQKLLEKESLTKVVEKVESAKKQVVAKENTIRKLAEKEKATEEEIRKKEIDQMRSTRRTSFATSCCEPPGRPRWRSRRRRSSWPGGGAADAAAGQAAAGDQTALAGHLQADHRAGRGGGPGQGRRAHPAPDLYKSKEPGTRFPGNVE